MDLGLTERVAIVGGASHDIGKHVALTLAGEGAKVALCARNEESLRRTEIELVRISSQQNILAIPADLSEPRDIRRVVRDTFNRFGQIDILVIRSGSPSQRQAPDSEEAALTAELERHFLSAVRLSREVAPYMKQEHWGRIINLEAIPSHQVADGAARFATRPLYLIGYFKTLAKELAPFNITVNSLLSGNLETRELKQILADRCQAEETNITDLIKKTCSDIPMGRLGKPEEIGAMVAFLASERAGYLTGASITIDGGQSQALW